MQRKLFPPRDDWQQRCRNVGFDYYSLPSSDGSMYWSDDVAYHFTTTEIDNIDDATKELHEICLALVDETVRSGDYPSQYGFSTQDIELIERSWCAKEPSLYGRFDLGYDGHHIKMLEYNADTPTSLLEAAVVQWDWLVDNQLPDQFNSLHEKLIGQLCSIKSSIKSAYNRPVLHFAAMRDAGREDWGNIEYLMDCAYQAGWEVAELSIEDIGWYETQNKFIDLNNNPIEVCFKLYPWEWLKQDEFAQHTTSAQIHWIEPAWKMLLSSKALLPLLWQKHNNYPFLLESHFWQPGMSIEGHWAKKPILSREGANVSKLIHGINQSLLSGSDFNSDYDQSGYVIQKWFDLPSFNGFRPVLGSWIVGNQTAGIGIREDYNVVTGNDSHFVPHYFTDNQDA